MSLYRDPHALEPDPRIPDCQECGTPMVKSWLDDVWECERCVQIKLTPESAKEARQLERMNCRVRRPA